MFIMRWSGRVRLLQTILFIVLIFGNLGVPSLANAEKIHLKFARWINNPSEVADQVELIKKYTEMNPNVEVELIQQPWAGYHEKMITMSAGGLTPDVMVLSRVHLPAFVENGIVQPIDQWFNNESMAFRNDVMDLISGTYEGKFYGISIAGGPTVFQYNADLFDQVGLVQPMDLAKKKAWTWDRFVEFGHKITQDTNGDGATDVFMHAKLNYTKPGDWYVVLRSFGADLITDTGAAFTDVQAIKEGLQFWSDLAWEQHIAPVGKETSNFTKGTEAMNIAWISSIPKTFDAVNNAFRVEITTPPAGPAGLFTLAGGCPIAVSADTPYPYEAYKFAKWFAMESGAWRLRGTPSSMTVMRHEYRDYLGSMYSWPDAVIESMSGAVSMEPGIGAHYNDLNKEWRQSLSAVASGSMSPGEGATRLVESTQRILAETK